MNGLLGGGEGYVGPLKIIGGGTAPPFLRLSIKMAEVKRFKYTASADDMQIMRTTTPNLLLDGIMPFCYKHVLFFYKTS